MLMGPHLNQPRHGVLQQKEMKNKLAQTSDKYGMLPSMCCICFWFFHKHNSLPLGLIHPSSPTTKELHGQGVFVLGIIHLQRQVGVALLLMNFLSLSKQLQLGNNLKCPLFNQLENLAYLLSLQCVPLPSKSYLQLYSTTANYTHKKGKLISCIWLVQMGFQSQRSLVGFESRNVRVFHQ